MNQEGLKARKNEHNITPLILGRWSPRAMSGESLSDEEIQALLEAAHWAPSSYNNQPWRFLYAKRGTPQWSLFFDLMIDFNKEWTKNAGLLLIMCSDKVFSHNKKPCRTHSFDTGAAWTCLALEAFNRGLVAHGMEGFDYDKARTVMKIPDHVEVNAMAAVGKSAPKTILSEKMQERESPSGRNPISSFAFEGPYPSTMA